MKLKSFYLLALALLLNVSALLGQSRIARAKQQMKDLNYVGAIELLTQILGKGDNSEAKINLAECYRKVNDSQNAEFLYGQVVRLPEAQPIHFLYYGEALQRNGKCDLAKEWYDKFTKAVPEDVRGQYLDKACDYEKELNERGLETFTVKRATINSNLDDFGSAFYNNGIIFASDRSGESGAVKRSHTWTGNPFLDLYYVPIKGCGSEVTYGTPTKFDAGINSKYHDAVVSLSADKKQIFFTRNNYSKGKSGRDDQGIMRLKIYGAREKGKGSFGDEESLAFNSDEYSCAHPSLSADGTKLYFTSDMPGGFGGMDLYVSELENGRWGPPMNMGPTINTEGNELFPFVSKTGRLYYSSDGNIGLGGLDIYYVDPKGGNQWSAPENVGAPINSRDDDFGITFNEDGTCGFFSSDRTGGSGRDDIYSFTKSATPVQIFVFDAVTKEPIEGATVSSDSCSKKMLKTGKDGKVTVDMKFNSCCTYAAVKEGFGKNSKEGCVKDPGAETEANVIEIPLSRDSKFNLEGIVFDQSTGLPLDAAKISLSNDCQDSVQTFTTDASGKFHFNLTKECCYKVKGEKEKYLAVSIGGDTLCTKGLTASKTLMANLNLQPTLAGLPGSMTETPTLAPGMGDSLSPGAKPKMGGETTHPMAVTGTPGKKIPKTGIYYDPDKGIYVNGKTKKPATGKHNGIAYKDGAIVDDPKTSVFVPSPTLYSDTAQNAQAYLLHIYYDFDQSFLRDESMPEMTKLEKMLHDNPTYIVEIASHTDARGSDSYNNRLSQRRAEAVVRWLVDKGVDRDRLVPRGYGETMTANRCVNQVPCSEKEHQMNRRTEFRVLGCKGCTDPKTAKLSKPNENAKVSVCKGCPF